MNHGSAPQGKIDFDDEPTTQEFLDAFLPSLEEQYSFERLRELPPSQLELEVEHANQDLEFLNWRLGHEDEIGNVTAHVVEHHADLDRSYDLERPTLDQIQQINWTIIRIERNINRAVRVAKNRANEGILSKIKRVSIGSDRFGGVSIDLTRQMMNGAGSAESNAPDRVSFDDEGA